MLRNRPEHWAFTATRGIRLARGIHPAAVFAAANEDAPAAFWLDGGTSQNSIIGRGTLVPLDRPFLPAIREALTKQRGGSGLGLVGWLSYDLGEETVGIPLAADPAYRTAFLAVAEAVEVNPEGDARLLVNTGAGRTEHQTQAHLWRARLRNAVGGRHDPGSRDLSVDWGNSDDEYRSMILACQERIVAGDAYQLCLTTRINIKATIDPLASYLRLRDTNGTSRGGVIRIGERWMLSTSPEEFLSVTDQGRLSTSPIKGTRPRGSTPAEDRALNTDLLESRKERAENVMIVDLMRNDFSRICEIGTVEVTRLFEVESHPQVHQLVSTVEGQLRDDLDAIDAITATFPAGSMTGAPKRSAMKILNELECGPRGLYAGAFGYLGCTGETRLSMTIRTITYQQDNIQIGTGGGITALSVPDEEVDEIHLKARALLAALCPHLDGVEAVLTTDPIDVHVSDAGSTY